MKIKYYNFKNELIDISIKNYAIKIYGYIEVGDLILSVENGFLSLIDENNIKDIMDCVSDYHLVLTPIK